MITALFCSAKKLTMPNLFAANSNAGNPMRGLDDSINLDEVLASHYNPSLAKQRIQQAHEIVGPNSKPLTDAELRSRGWEEAYDLRPWHEFPDTDRISIPKVVLQNLTWGWFGAGGGPTRESNDFAETLRQAIVNN